MHDLFIDLETYSSVPIAEAGLYKYAQSPDFEILLFSWSWDWEPVRTVDLTCGEQIPAPVVSFLWDPGVRKHAYNAAFEWYCLSRYFDRRLPADQWRDTMLHSLYCGYPASLDAAGRKLGLPADSRKLSTGRALIKTFCTPRAATERDPRTRIRPGDEPEKWRRFKEYNAQDVVAEMEIERRLSAFPVPDQIQQQWVQDLEINARGIGVDLDLMHGALEIDAKTQGQLTEEAKALSGLDNPNSTAQLTEWLRNQGVRVNTLRKDDVIGLLEQDQPANVRRMLEIRQDSSRTSTKKYAAMESAVCDDGRIRGVLQFYGANRTGRWAGRIIQPQNLPRTYLHGKTLDLARECVRKRETEKIDLLIGSVPDVLSQLVRTALVPAPGHKFIDADFSAIEARVIAWLAGEEWVLEVFRTHGKIYEACAAQMFGVPLEKIKKGNSEYALRQKGKVATLALGYQGGTGSLIQMGALKMGISEEELPDIVQRWRQSNKRIVDLWYAVEHAAVDTVQTCRQNGVRGILFSREADPHNDFLTVQLPSGRKLYYCRPRIITDDRGRPKIQYDGTNQTTKKWGALETYGGKLVENIVQAIARDCLAVNIDRLERAGYPVVFHVHDEVVIDAAPNQQLNDVIAIMRQPIEWAPGLPLNADGWEGGYYTKD